MADPRIARTHSKLQDAVLTLASGTAVEEVTVDQACAASGVSRATFYRHASSPADILQRIVHRELDRQRSDFVADATGRGPALRRVHRRLIHRLCIHLGEFAPAYALSLPRDHSALGAVLGEHLYESCLEYVRARRDDIPELAGAALQDQPFVEEALARSYAGGQLGLIRAWIASSPRHLVALETLMLELAPAWNRRLMGL